MAGAGVFGLTALTAFRKVDVELGDGWLAVGGGFVGAPDANTPLPQSMMVDWVRVYRLGS